MNEQKHFFLTCSKIISKESRNMHSNFRADRFKNFYQIHSKNTFHCMKQNAITPFILHKFYIKIISSIASSNIILLKLFIFLFL